MINILKKVNKKTKCKACKTVFTYDAEDVKTDRAHRHINYFYSYVICPICETEMIIYTQQRF